METKKILVALVLVLVVVMVVGSWTVGQSVKKDMAIKATGLHQGQVSYTESFGVEIKKPYRSTQTTVVEILRGGVTE
ncbi:hypothetical protein ACFLZB_03545 [Nanoarchaeota archaeon]